ncbi:hypothetical protein M0811_04185 [Anaeramoeba ignava]|uniref:Uncharacterized protein n=1 Tax=Anaeramoeba ignava TaxID=1746090 RepID=A0A9Q0RH43_ANAIG|nr:hypothetical protein M0811_04185 [Anaeramoeba ignava]
MTSQNFPKENLPQEIDIQNLLTKTQIQVIIPYKFTGNPIEDLFSKSRNFILPQENLKFYLVINKPSFKSKKKPENTILEDLWCDFFKSISIKISSNISFSEHLFHQHFSSSSSSLQKRYSDSYANPPNLIFDSAKLSRNITQLSSDSKFFSNSENTQLFHSPNDSENSINKLFEENTTQDKGNKRNPQRKIPREMSPRSNLRSNKDEMKNINLLIDQNENENEFENENENQNQNQNQNQKKIYNESTKSNIYILSSDIKKNQYILSNEDIVYILETKINVGMQLSTNANVVINIDMYTKTFPLISSIFRQGIDFNIDPHSFQNLQLKKIIQTFIPNSDHKKIINYTESPRKMIDNIYRDNNILSNHFHQSFLLKQPLKIQFFSNYIGEFNLVSVKIMNRDQNHEIEIKKINIDLSSTRNEITKAPKPKPKPKINIYQNHFARNVLSFSLGDSSLSQFLNEYFQVVQIHPPSKSKLNSLLNKNIQENLNQNSITKSNKKIILKPKEKITCLFKIIPKPKSKNIHEIQGKFCSLVDIEWSFENLPDSLVSKYEIKWEIPEKEKFKLQIRKPEIVEKNELFKANVEVINNGGNYRRFSILIPLEKDSENQIQTQSSDQSFQNNDQDESNKKINEPNKNSIGIICLDSSKEIDINPYQTSSINLRFLAINSGYHSFCIKLMDQESNRILISQNCQIYIN